MAGLLVALLLITFSVVMSFGSIMEYEKKSDSAYVVFTLAYAFIATVLAVAIMHFKPWIS